MRGKQWAGVGAALIVTGLLAGAVAWSSLDRNPPRLSLVPPDGSRPQGFTEDGREFLTLGPEGMVFWDRATGHPRRPWSLLSFPVAEFSSDGRIGLGVHGYSFDDATVGLVDLASGEFRARFSSRFPSVVHLAFVDEGRSIRAFVGDRDRLLRGVVTWEIASGAEERRAIQGPKGPGFSWRTPAGYSPDGRTLAYLDLAQNGVQLWDAESDQPVGGLLRTPSTRFTSWTTAAFSRDGQELIVGRDDGAVEVWTLADRRWIRTIPTHPTGYTSTDLQISPDGRTLASTGTFQSSPTGVDRLLFAVRNLVEKTNRRAFLDETVLVDLTSGRRLARWPRSVEPKFSPDGRTVVTHNWDDGTFSFHDVPQTPRQQRQ